MAEISCPVFFRLSVLSALLLGGLLVLFHLGVRRARSHCSVIAFGELLSFWCDEDELGFGVVGLIFWFRGVLISMGICRWKRVWWKDLFWIFVGSLGLERVVSMVIFAMV